MINLAIDILEDRQKNSQNVLIRLNKISVLVNKTSSNELMLAARISLNKSGKRNALEFLSMLNSNTESEVNLEANNILSYTPDEALALYGDGDFTKSSYKLMLSGVKLRNAKIYPSYDLLLQAKKKCYPVGVQVADTFAEVTLQSLVDHTSIRIIESKKDTFSNLTENTITAIYKWGCDGNSGNSAYRQKFSVSDFNRIDENIFAICIVPLQMKMGNIILWDNDRPSLTRFCRPIK